MLLYEQKPDLAAIAGIVLIIAGVLVLNLFSKMSAH
jgi:small multidrug resistance pump